MTMTTPQMERILLQLKATLTSPHAPPAHRAAVALRQINTALAEIEPPYVLCVGRVEKSSREIVIKTARARKEPNVL